MVTVSQGVDLAHGYAYDAGDTAWLPVTNCAVCKELQADVCVVLLERLNHSSGFVKSPFRQLCGGPSEPVD